MAQQFSHPSFGNKAEIEIDGNIVRLSFHAHTREQAESLAEMILSQMRQGGLHLTVMGKVSSIEGSFK